MPISDIPILSMLRTRMQWHQARQQVLAENVANADTPNYQAKDLAPPTFENMLSTASIGLDRTQPGRDFLRTLQRHAATTDLNAAGFKLAIVRPGLH